MTAPTLTRSEVGIVDTREGLRLLAEWHLDGEHDHIPTARMAETIKVFAPTLIDLSDDEVMEVFVERLCGDVALFRRWHMGEATWEDVLGAGATGTDRDGQAEIAVAERVEDTLRTLTGVTG